MPRIPYPDPATLPPENREFLASLPQLNISRMLAVSPSMFRPLTGVFNAYLNNGVLSPRMREIVILRVAFLCESEYEIVNHKRVARLIGMSDEDVAALQPGADASVLSDEERLVLQFADEIVRDGGAGEQSFAELAKIMSPAELMEVTVVAGVYHLVSQICATFGIEPEEVPIADTGLDEIQRTVDRFR